MDERRLLNIGLDDVMCSGNESSIMECGHLGAASHNCQRQETVAIHCTGPPVEEGCLTACPTGFFSYGDGPCLQCDRKCLICAMEAFMCSECVEPYFLLRNSSECSMRCPNNMYKDWILRECIQCSHPCKMCEHGGTKCTSCVEDYVLYNKKCVQLCDINLVQYTDMAEITQCVEKCPPGFIISLSNSTMHCVECDSRCRTCENETSNCTECTDGRVLQLAENNRLNHCRMSCDEGYYVDKYLVCRRCEDRCRRCHPGGVYCAECESGYSLLLGRCMAECSKGLYSVGGRCLDRCPDGYYGQQITGECRPCGAACRHCTSSDGNEKSKFINFFFILTLSIVYE